MVRLSTTSKMQNTIKRLNNRWQSNLYMTNWSLDSWKPPRKGEKKYKKAKKKRDVDEETWIGKQEKISYFFFWTKQSLIFWNRFLFFWKKFLFFFKAYFILFVSFFFKSQFLFSFWCSCFRQMQWAFFQSFFNLFSALVDCYIKRKKKKDKKKRENLGSQRFVQITKPL